MYETQKIACLGRSCNGCRYADRRCGRGCKKEEYLQEQKAQELKQLNEIGAQKHFAKSREKQEEELLEQIREQNDSRKHKYS